MASMIIRLLITTCWVVVCLGFLFISDFKGVEDESVLHVLTWPNIIDPNHLHYFEKKTGTKVRLSYYESNEELIVKLRATEGKGYDIVIPSDYAVDLLAKEGLLKPLDKEQLPFISQCNPMLLDLYFDPQNNYSIPFEWGVFGLGVNKSVFSEDNIDSSWNLAFNFEDTSKRVVMVNEAREAFHIALYYLFGEKQSYSESELLVAKDLLSKQKKYAVELYSESRSDYLLATNNCDLAVSSSAYIWRGIKRYPNIRFIAPKEGVFVTIESIALVKNSKKDNLIYPFLNYLYSSDVIQHNFETFSYLPALIPQKLRESLSDEMIPFITPEPGDFKTLLFFKPFEDEKKIQDLWIKVKAS